MAKGQKTGGRKPGTPNKTTGEIREIALAMTPAATARLQKLLGSDSEAVALGAVREVYDRAFGKASQIIAGDPDRPMVWQEVRRTLVRPGHTNS